MGSIYDSLIRQLQGRERLRPADRHDATPLTTQAEVDAVLCGYRPKSPKEMAPRKPGCPF